MDGRFRPWNSTVYPHTFDLTQFHDAHAPRPGHSSAQWEVTRRLLIERLNLTNDEVEWMDQYVLQFQEIMANK